MFDVMFRHKSQAMIVCICNLFFLFHVINGQRGNYQFLMPDLPPVRSSPVASLSVPSTTRENHPFLTRSFTKINLSGGPFNVKLYHNPNSNDNYTSVEVEADSSMHKLISINIEQNDILTVRMIDNLNINNKTNITITIIYQQLTELNIDGLINIQCINQIQANVFRLYNRGTGSIKLKLNVNILDAYLHSIGRVKLCGQVKNEATLKSLGVGDVECRNLVTRKINVISSGIGDIYITATDEINVTLSGIGTVYYSGPIKQQIKTGLGNIMEMPRVISSNEQQRFEDDLN